MKYIIFVLLTIAACLNAIDIQLGDKIDLGGIHPYQSIKIGDGLFLSNTGRTRQIFRIDGDNIELLDTDIGDNHNYPIRQLTNSTFLIAHLHQGIDVYQIDNNELLCTDTIIEYEEPGTEYLLQGLNVLGTNLFQCHLTFPNEETVDSRWEIYNIEDLHEPELVSSIVLSANRVAFKAFQHDNHYYFVEYTSVIKVCDDLTTMELQPATEDWPDTNYISDAILYDDHLFVVTLQNDTHFLDVFSFTDSGILHLEDERQLYSGIHECCMVQDDEIVFVGNRDFDDFAIVRFHWINNELSEREDFQIGISGWTLNLYPDGDGYFGFTNSDIYRIDHDFDNQNLLSTSPYYYFQEIIMDRYLLLLVDSDQNYSSNEYCIYDLHTRDFLPFETNGWFSINKYRSDKDSWEFWFDNYVQIVKMGDYGIESITNLDVPGDYLTFSIYDDLACLAFYVNDEVIFRLYRIEGDQLSFLSEYNPDFYANSSMFLDDSHIFIIENYTYHLGIHYYRIESDYSLSEISFMPNTTRIFKSNSVLLPFQEGLCPYDISDMDNPIELAPLEVPGYQFSYNYAPSSNGDSHYLFSDNYFKTFITDDQFNTVFQWQDSQVKFLNDNNIVICSGSSLVLAQVNGLDSNDETIPMASPSALLHPNHPNPFNPETTISFDLSKRGHARLEIYNVRGQKVATLLDEVLDAGSHSIVWKPQHAASGVYFSRLWTDRHESVRKMILLK